MSYFRPLREELKKYMDKQQIKAVHTAYLLAEKAHEPQKRSTGEPYISHPAAVATILAKLRLDQQTIIAAILHDVIEDTPYTKADIIEQFGQEVANLVDGVTKLTKIKFETREQANAENFRKMVLAMAKDTRVILIKMADRLHNMRTLGALSAEKRARIASETLEIYAPIANRLGMHSFRVEFEDLGFSSLYPERYRVLRLAVRRARGNRKEIVSAIDRALRARLNQHHVGQYALYGREKHLYSIYKKMRDKHLTFSEIMDIYAFRIILDDIDTCYRVLGIVHNLYKPIPRRFKDYIAIPKANGYRSLHSVLFGPFGVPVEVQIRTREMDRIAESGVSAHWIYKEEHKDFGNVQKQAREWIKGVMEMQKSANTSIEFVENVKTDLFPDEVYVFTPKGKIIKLPTAATPVDFAYAVHSDVGNTCIAARVNRHLAPLSVPLESGQTVEIITSAGATPNPSWFDFVKTGKARSNIRHYIKSRQRKEAVKLGKRLLRKALQSLNEKLKEIPEDRLQALVSIYQLKLAEDLYSEIGLGNRNAIMVAKQLVQEEDLEIKQAVASLSIKGTEGMIMKFASCCHPIPGDVIMGVLDKGHGIFVHRESCQRIDKARISPQDLLTLTWSDEVSGEFSVDIIVELDNRRGILAALALAIAETGSNIDNISAEEVDGQYFWVDLLIGVHDRVHLARLLRRIRRLPGLMRVARRRTARD